MHEAFEGRRWTGERWFQTGVEANVRAAVQKQAEMRKACTAVKFSYIVATRSAAAPEHSDRIHVRGTNQS